MLNHRLMLKAEAEVEGVTADEIIRQDVGARGSRAVTRPVPTRRFFMLALLGFVPAALALGWPALLQVTAAWDVCLVVACAIDFFLAPRSVSVERVVEPVLSSGAPNRVTLRLEALGGGVTGEVRDTASGDHALAGNRQTFSLTDRLEVVWTLTPKVRGDVTLGPIALRLLGPLSLCARQVTVPLVQTVKIYPDLRALSRDALELARSHDADSKRLLRRPAEGREFESLREYRVGDDRRTLDWKATARRGRPMVRVYQPEKNQTVLLLIDCGRHMAGEVRGRRKLEHAVDAALRLAKVSLDQGDLVGVMTFGSTVKTWLPPRKGLEQLRAIAGQLYRAEATLEESDYGAALDRVFDKGSRRSLVVVLTDLMDLDTSGALVKRTLALVPRHLPLVASLLDEDLQARAKRMPETSGEAYERQVAARLEDDYRLTAARLRDAGARVVRASPAAFGPAAVNAYLDVEVERSALTVDASASGAQFSDCSGGSRRTVFFFLAALFFFFGAGAAGSLDAIRSWRVRMSLMHLSPTFFVSTLLTDVPTMTPSTGMALMNPRHRYMAATAASA